jgi:solute carrier family 35, member F5
MLWFSANYFTMACLQYTTVASTTILTSTSGIWTLLVGSITRTEKFTWRKLCGVIASLVGIMIISSVDLRNPSTNQVIPSRAMDSFPDKSPAELALGDALALLSAVLYGCYTISLKRATLTAAPLQLNMPVFFGLVGLFNFALLWPLFPILSWTGLEEFSLPPTGRVWKILLINSASSMLSDICWAYSMVLTSPLVVTVGLSLTIPLSLVGEIFIQGRTEALEYWIGAIVVVFSFVFVDREEVKDEGQEPIVGPIDVVDGAITGVAAQTHERASEELLR